MKEEKSATGKRACAEEGGAGESWRRANRLKQAAHPLSAFLSFNITAQCGVEDNGVKKKRGSQGPHNPFTRTGIYRPKATTKKKLPLLIRHPIPPPPATHVVKVSRHTHKHTQFAEILAQAHRPPHTRAQTGVSTQPPWRLCSAYTAAQYPSPTLPGRSQRPSFTQR